MSAVIGVVVPAYNARQFIEHSIASLLYQDVEHPYTIIVVDDGSTDDTTSVICRRFGEEIAAIEDHTTGQVVAGSRQGRVLVVRQANRHISGARNTGFGRACELGCDFVCHLDADDIALPNRLRVLSDYLLSHPDVGLVHSKNLAMTFEGCLFHSYLGGDRHWGADPEIRCYETGGAFSNWGRSERGHWKAGDLAIANYISNPAVMYSRWALERLGKDNWYIEGMRYGEDHAFHLKFEQAGVRIGFVPKFVAICRAHFFGATGDQFDRVIDLHEQARTALYSSDVIEKTSLYQAGARRCGGIQAFLGTLPELESDYRALLHYLQARLANAAKGTLPETRIFYLALLKRLSSADSDREDLSSALAAYQRMLVAAAGAADQPAQRCFDLALRAHAIAPSADTARLLREAATDAMPY